MRKTREQRVFIAVFLAPALCLFTLFVTVPCVRALLYSLQKWNGLTAPEWVGLQNFVDVLGDRDLFLVALGHNLFLMVVGGVCTLGLALLFAAVIHRRIHGARIFRVTFFFPNVMSSVAVALLWTLLYSASEFGVINHLLIAIQERLGWPTMALPFPFAASQHLIYAVIPLMVWTAVGFYMILFLAAMENIPESFYEAARLDGASAFAQFRHITLPLIREVLVVGLVFLAIAGLKFFDIIWVMESQIPTRDSHVLATLLYQKAFTEYNMGYGSAVAVLLFVLVFLATLVTLRFSRKEALEY